MITIILPISRREYLKPVFDCLANLEKPSDTELLIITDGSKELQKAVDNRLDAVSFKRIQVLHFSDEPKHTIDERRFRIAAIHNKAKHSISEDCEYVFCVEDDTVYPPNTLTQLLNFIQESEENVFIEGVQLGRHGTPYVGAWVADDVETPTHIRSLLPDGLISEIDAGGLYCALIDAELYKVHTFTPFDKYGKNGLGCDVNFGLFLRQQGYKCYIDWYIRCDHIGEKGSVNLGNTKPRQVVFEKNNNEWLGRTV